LFEVLSGQDQSAEFASLKPDSRRTILEILVSTKPGLPASWKAFLQETQSREKHDNFIRAATGAGNR
jgi:hypothetical protein